ncbi:MAG: hypothetical protein AAFV43_10170 [Planctomycetota bacterium]
MLAEATSDAPEATTDGAPRLVQEYVDCAGQTLQSDRRRGVLRGVKLLGLISKNGRVYREGALRSAMHLYDGAKVNVNHPSGDALAPRDYRDRLGVIRNVSVRSGQGLFGDLHFNPNHALAEQLAWDAEHAPENVGLSHNVAARTSRDGAKLVVESIARVHSVDLVADPATTSGLFEQQSVAPSQEPLDEQPAGQNASEAVETPETAGPADTVGKSAEAEELAALREEVAALRRADTVRRVLAEHGFTGVDDPAVDEALVRALEAAPDQAAMAELVEQRAAMVERIGAQGAASAVCESRASDPLASGDRDTPENVAEFVASITRR